LNCVICKQGLLYKHSYGGKNAIYLVITPNEEAKISYTRTIPTEKWENARYFSEYNKFAIKINDKRIYHYNNIDFSSAVRELFRSIFEGLNITKTYDNFNGNNYDDIFITISLRNMSHSRDEVLWYGNIKSYINGSRLDGGAIGMKLENEFYYFVYNWKNLYFDNGNVGNDHSIAKKTIDDIPKIKTNNDFHKENIFFEHKSFNNGTTETMRLKGSGLLLLIFLIMFIKDWWRWCLASLIVFIVSIPLYMIPVYMYVSVRKDWSDLKTKFVVFFPTFLIIFFIMLYPVAVTLGFDNKKIQQKFSKKETTKMGMVISDGLNMRTGPGTDYPVIQILSYGTDVLVYEQGNWYYIGVNGVKGYVNSKYVKLY